ncbi:MAG: hypothetical protein ACFE8M_05430 [Candidatus Hermodarchaeota archaeon]
MTIEIFKSADKRRENRFFENLWIIERKSGICLFHKSFRYLKNKSLSVDLICGFLSAIAMLASEAFAEDIRYIKLSNSKLYFQYTANFLFILSVQNETLLNPYKIKTLINNISDLFVFYYDKDFESWDRDIHKFKAFTKYLENLNY